MQSVELVWSKVGKRFVRVRFSERGSERGPGEEGKLIRGLGEGRQEGGVLPAEPMAQPMSFFGSRGETGLGL